MRDHPKIHCLKTRPDNFEAIMHGLETLDARANDRDFQAGDYLWLQEYDPDTDSCTGRELMRQITYILSACPWLPSNMVAMTVTKRRTEPDETEVSKMHRQQHNPFSVGRQSALGILDLLGLRRINIGRRYCVCREKNKERNRK